MACMDHPCAVFEISTRPGAIFFRRDVAVEYARGQGDAVRVARLWHVFDYMRGPPRACALCGVTQEED